MFQKDIMPTGLNNNSNYGMIKGKDPFHKDDDGSLVMVNNT
jgi:hypothetical protein